jgi:hypothetical protein
LKLQPPFLADNLMTKKRRVNQTVAVTTTVISKLREQSVAKFQLTLSLRITTD